jgi:hypothetical protein
VHPNATRSSFEHPYWGELPIPGSLAAAVHADHPCEDNHCDIRQALDEGYPRIAAALLSSATDELPYLDAYADSLPDGHDDLAAFDKHAPYDLPEWDEWAAWHKANTVECPGCGAYCDRPGYAGTTCANCLGVLPVDEEGGDA